MNIEIVEKSDHLKLIEIWESSVRATMVFGLAVKQDPSKTVARRNKVITGWRVINSVNIAERYNGYDEFYKSKLDFIVNDLFPQKGL